MSMNAMFGYGLRGKVQVSVVERGRVVQKYPTQSNLILNQGLDQFATNYLGACFQYAVAGTGSTPTELDSVTDTVTTVGGLATITNPGFLTGTSADTGNTIKVLPSGPNYTITAPISTTQCSVSPLTSSGPSSFIVYNTNQTGLAAEVKRTNTYLTGAPNCQTLSVGNQTVMTRTFDFSAEVGSITYNEVGFSYSATPGANLFSRILLASGVPLTAGQQLRVQYSIQIGITPNTPLALGTSPIIGWAGATGQLQVCEIPIYAISTTGSLTLYFTDANGSVYNGYGEPNSPSGCISLSTDSAAFPSYGAASTAPLTVYQSAAPTSYVVGSYTRSCQTIFPVGSANATNWRSIYLTEVGGSSNMVKFLMDSVQTKVSTYTLTLGFTKTWNRVL